MNDALARVLTDVNARHQLADGGPEALGLAEEDARHLRHLTAGETGRRFATVVDKIRAWILDGTFGGGGVQPYLPASLAHLAGKFGSEAGAIDAFMASPAFASVDCIGVRRDGMSAVEAFYSWASDEVQPEALVTLQHELVAGLATILARAPDPAFTVAGWLVRQYPPGWLGVVDARRALRGPRDEPDEPLVYAVANGRLKRGRVSRLAAACLVSSVAAPPEWATARVTAADRSATSATEAALRSKGLL